MRSTVWPLAVLLVAGLVYVNTPSDTDNVAAPAAPSQQVATIGPTETTDVSTEFVSTKVVANGAAEKILLGGPELVSGIPGSGALTLDDAREWFANPANHRTIEPELPFGLAAGKTKIAGIAENPLTRAKIELGRQLYFDTRLSSDNTISCASCHDPATGYAAPTQFGVGVDGQEGNRNSPTAYNRIVSEAQFWDGRAASLEAQAVGPIENPIEMANTHEATVKMLSEHPIYTLEFEAVFDDGVTIDNVGRAIASFERVIVTGPTPWDYYDRLANFEQAFAADLEDLEALEEDDPDLYEEYMEIKQQSEAHPISESAIRGGKLFFDDRSNCTACHVGANYTDELYHNLGVGMDADEPDLGRYTETNEDKDKGTFKTPTIRNVAQTAPYMHDGSQETLEEVVQWYVDGGHPNQWLDEEITKLEISEEEQKDLVEFMKALTGSLPEVESARLPK